MLKDLNPKRKFNLLLIAIHILSLPIISTITYFILKDHTLRDATTTGKLHLATIAAVKHYVAEDLRPLLYRELPGRFIAEGMSRSFVAVNIAERVQKEFPSYVYKNASLKPKNPHNAADPFESGIIADFIKDRNLKEWNGFRTKSDGEYYVIARAGEPVGPDCLICHGDPAIAPKELIERYGATAGFNMKIGELADATFVYIPIGVPLASARKAVAVFIGIYIVFGFIIFLIITHRFSLLYNRIDTDKKRIEEINVELLNLNQDMESIIAERTMNLIALSVADRVRNPAAVIAGTFNRILRKESISEPLRERISDMMAEAQRLDAIVKDYETILKNKQVMFRGEDMNEIIQSVLPLIEGERKGKDIGLSLKLSESPAWFIANRQLLRVVVLHILKNAVEATPAGGTITVETASDQDRVSLRVTDTGKGIPPEEVPKIFSLFYSTKKHRIGMGLPLVKQIIEEHKGDITVESELGKGTTFRLVFPVRWSDQELKGKDTAS